MRKKTTQTKKKTAPQKKTAPKKKVAKAEKPIGKVSHYFDNIKVAAITLKGPLKNGDTIRIEGGDVLVKVKVAGMQKNHKPISSAKAKDEIGLKVQKKVREGYRAYKA